MSRLLHRVAKKILTQGRLGRRAFRIGARLWRFAYRVIGMLVWPFPAVGKLWRWTFASEKRVLAIWDTRAQPYAIGDMLVFLEGTLVVRETNKAAKIDICILSDEQQYKLQSPNFTEITSDNRLKYILALIRLVQVNPYFGSLFLFNSQAQMETFVADNAHNYNTWPPAGAYISREYTYYRIFDMIAAYYSKNGRIPYLSSNRSTMEWAKSFLSQHASSDVPAVVQVRKNPVIDTARNSRMDSWLELFDYCQARLPIKFIVVCGIDEIDPRLRERPNVVVAKDFGTTVEQDLALIESSAFFMCSTSGMSAMGFFSAVPYAVINWPMLQHHPDVFPTVMDDVGQIRLVWATPHQRLIPEAESILVLIRECNRLFESVDVDAWVRRSADKIIGSETTLRLW